MSGGTRPIVFLSDFGLQDEFVGICHAVVARIAPAVRVTDLTHGISPHDVRRGAIVLADAMPYLPANSVILAVVDPGVGTDRRSLCVEARSGVVLVGPDNGLLSLAWEVAGGLTRAVEITLEEVLVPPVSRTFHGRDVFAPAAALVAIGEPVERLGPSVDPASLVRIPVPEPMVRDGRVEGEVLGIDRFGNVQLNVRSGHLAEAGLIESGTILKVTANGREIVAPLVQTFAEAEEGETAVIVDSSDRAALVRAGANAAETLGLRPGDRVVVERFSS